MRRFKDGDTIVLEPWRAKAFPLIKDLVVDRSAFDRIIQAGGYTSVNVGGAPDANGILISTNTVEQAMDSAACIGCGACVAACKNASAVLFTSAKVSHLALLPQGQVERQTRVVSMVERHDAEGFGSCSNEGRMRGGLPEGDLDHQHRPDEPRVLPGDAGFETVTRSGIGIGTGDPRTLFKGLSVPDHGPPIPTPQTLITSSALSLQRPTSSAPHLPPASA